MSDVLTIAGSPSQTSRSADVLTYIRKLVERHGLSTDSIRVRDLNAEELLHGRFDGASVRENAAKVADARAIIIATPVYKAAYSGILKAFLDVLPQQALADKVVLPIATGGSAAHLLAIDYALKPVLSALGAQQILGGLYILDAQAQYGDNAVLKLDTDIEDRLHRALQTLTRQLAKSELAAIAQ
jgi:FMN reductase